jgi:uncharacterized membrane protein
MQTAIILTAVVGYLATIVLAALRERFSGGRWEGFVTGLQYFFLVLWLGSMILIVVFVPESSTPDPRF